MPTVEIVPAKTVTHVKSSVGVMPTPTKVSAEPPSVSGLPSQSKPSAAPPVPAPVVPVTESDKSAITPAPRKAAQEMFEKLRNKGKPEEPAKPAEEAHEQKTEEPEKDDVEGISEQAGKDDSKLPTDPEKPGEKPAEEKTAEPKPKVNPWKLVDEWKAKAAETEKQLIETKKLIKDEATVKSEAARLEAIEKRNKELEEHIRYVDYSKSQEFTEKYQKPYQEAWQQAVSEMSEMSIVDENGNDRKPTASDLLEIVNLPVTKAKARAEELFGDFAGEVMGHRKEIVRLFQQQNEALKKARTEAAEHEKRVTRDVEARKNELQKFARETWEKLSEAATADPENGEFFKTVEGDEARNTVLTKGFELVDSSSRENPLDPRLSPEDRSSIIKRHIAIRNRAAAYGVVKHLLAKVREEKAALQEKLKQYEQSVPDTSGISKTTTSTTPSRASDDVFGALRKLAKH